jgi:hypothetical protein
MAKNIGPGLQRFTEYQVEKVYKKNDQWISTNSFDETELLE